MESIIPLSATSFLLHLICSLKKQFSATNNHGPAATPGHNGPEKLRLIKTVERPWSRHQWAACEAAAQARAASSCISAASLGCTNLLQRTLLQRWRGGPGPDHGQGRRGGRSCSPAPQTQTRLHRYGGRGGARSLTRLTLKTAAGGGRRAALPADCSVWSLRTKDNTVTQTLHPGSGLLECEGPSGNESIPGSGTVWIIQTI